MCFWLIFDLGGDPPYEWWGPQVMGIIIFSNFISGILCNVLGPLGLVRLRPARCPPSRCPPRSAARFPPPAAQRRPPPASHRSALPRWLADSHSLPCRQPEALKKGWFVVIRESSVPWWLLPIIKVRRGIPRYIAIGLAVAPIYWPPAIPIARYVVGPTFVKPWTQIWFGVSYCIAVAPAVTILGCLAFALEPNYKRIEDMMSNHKSPCKRLGLRFCGCLKLLW